MKQHLRQALGFLDQARRIGTPSRAFHLRRARYLEHARRPRRGGQGRAGGPGCPLDQVLDHFLMADELYRREKFAEAIKEFDRVLERKPGHFWAQYLECDLPAAPGAARRGAQPCSSACLAQRSDFVWLYLLRGFAQEELQAWAAADSDFQKAAQLPLDENARYVLVVNRGVLRVRQERFEDAVTDLKAAIELKPNAYQAYVNLAQAYRRLGKLDLALDQLNRAVELEPGLAHLYRLRARLHLERNEPDLALADFDQAIGRENTQLALPGRRPRRTRPSVALRRQARRGPQLVRRGAGACKRTIRWGSDCGRRRCSGWAVSRRSSRRSTATWRQANRWSRSIEAAAWPGPSWASTRAPSKISRRPSSCTRPRPCRPIGAGRIWSSTPPSWPCATSSWPSSSIPKTATPTTAGASCAPAWAATARPSQDAAEALRHGPTVAALALQCRADLRPVPRPIP